MTLPALRPALAGATLLTFLTALASFSAPYLFGGGFRVMTTQIVASRLNGNHRLAMAESLLLAALALVALGASGSLAGAQEVAASGHGVAPRARRIAGWRGGRYVRPACLASSATLPSAIRSVSALLTAASSAGSLASAT